MEKTTRRLPIVERDEWLLPAEQELNRRYERYTDKINAIEQAAGSIVDYANGYRYFGWQRDELLDGWWLREWLPGAHDVYVFGDFNNWQRTEIRMQRDAHGRMERLLPGGDVPRPAPRTGRSTSSTSTATTAGKTASRPTPRAWYRTRRRRTTRPSSGRRSRSTGGATRSTPRRTAACMIYEAHVGMAQEKRGRGHLPRIHGKNTTYNQKGRLQRRAADGRRRAPLLRVVRLPRVEFLRTRHRAAARPRS